MEQLEPDLSMLFLVAGGLLEDVGDLVVAFLLGGGSIVGILVAGLGFTGKSGHQIGFGLGTFQIHKNLLLREIILGKVD